MAEVKWSGVLSTTEPRNDVGIIKVRQGNVNSEVAEFQIVQRNKPYDLTGLTVYFCANFGLNLVEKQAVVVNERAGKIQYTFDDDSMQALGKQKGYFSIKKEDNKIDSTQDFEYQVESSLMTRSIDGKSYIYKLSALIKILDDFVKNGQKNFNTWFDSVKEILYGVDPGGNILRELIEARKNSSGNIFASLKERLDKNEDDTNRQLAQTFNFATRIYLDLISRGVNALYPPEGYEACIGDGAADDTVALKALIKAFDVVVLPPKKYRVTDTIKVGSRWKALIGFVNIARDEENAATIIYDGPTNNRKSAVIIGQNEVGAEPTIDASGIVFQNIVVDANNKVGFSVYGTYLTNETTLSGIRAKNSLEYDYYLAKSWYAKISDLVSLGCRGQGIAIGMPLEYLDGTNVNWTTPNPLEMNNCEIKNLRSVSAGKYFSEEHKNTYKATTPSLRRKGYGVGIGIGNGIHVETITSEKAGGAGLYELADYQPIRSISKVYLENNCFNSGLSITITMANMIIEHTSPTGGAYELKDFFMNFNSGGIYFTGVLGRKVKLKNFHQPRFLKSLDGLTENELYAEVLKDNVHYECGYYNTDSASLEQELYMTVNTRYSFEVPIFQQKKQKMIYIKAPDGGDGSFVINYADGTKASFNFPTNNKLTFFRAIDSDAVSITKGGGGTGTIDKKVDIAIISPPLTTY